MSLTLHVSIPSSTSVNDSSGSYTGFVAQCRYGDDAWTVIHRYSQFYDLKTRMEKEAIQTAAPFPPKKFGSVTGDALEKRRAQLDEYMQELSGSFMPEHLQAVLFEFVELKKNIGKASPAAKGEAAADAASAGGASVEPPSAPAPPSQAQVWDEKFMSEDPLAALMQQASVEEAPKPPPAAERAAKPAKPSADAAAASSQPAAALPSFLSHTQAKSYAHDGEGLRDAIKNRDVHGVKSVLEAEPSLANYKDRQAESMLHLAAIFNHTEIADLLLKAGADPLVKNADGETAIDVAQFSLKKKFQTAAAAK